MSDRRAILKLAAYLIRQAACLEDDEPVILDVGAETVRLMALAALREVDKLNEWQIESVTPSKRGTN